MSFFLRENLPMLILLSSQYKAISYFFYLISSPIAMSYTHKCKLKIQCIVWAQLQYGELDIF